ncbi:hypothetical protein BGZ74_011169 [Mortierella antarctica]|nr:hypothetical protein BGZ74_011169 [Mortierella antarctica]
MDNHIVVNQSWGPQAPPIYKCKNPILQFRHNVGQHDSMNDMDDYFTEEVFVAPFNLIWSTEKPSKDHGTDYIQTNVPSMAWRKILWYLFCHQINPFSHTYVYPHYYTLHMLNNPAIEALIQYKWNKFAYRLWLARFSAQFSYYSLIVIAAATQIYSDDPDSLFYVFVAIVALSSWFLALELYSACELWKARRSQTYRNVDPKRLSYFRSFYNYVDLLAFLVPLTASINQLKNISEKDPGGTAWDLSFSIIVIFLHMLSELRVFKAFCKYVTIIIHIIVEIRVFFVIFALGILSFTLAIQHVLRGCPSKGGIDGVGCRNLISTEFQYNFFDAITSTYFIMGGRYDDVDNELSKSSNAPLQAMLVIYFFFTVILMLNVLIALINGGFNQGDGTWRLVWLENRLRYVESAEEMTYHIPGFRQTKDWFPREIYYTATKEQVSEYEDKVLKKKGDIEDIIEKRIKDALEERLSEHQKQSENHMESQFEKLMGIVTKADIPSKNDEGGPEAKTNATEDNSTASGERDDDDAAVEEEDTAVIVTTHVSEVSESAGPSSSRSSKPSHLFRSSSSSQQAHVSEDGVDGNNELQQLRALVGDLVKQQEDSRQHSLQLEKMLVQVLQTLTKDV